jgi:hypothetical protein
MIKYNRLNKSLFILNNFYKFQIFNDNMYIKNTSVF